MAPVPAVSRSLPRSPFSSLSSDCKGRREDTTKMDSTQNHAAKVVARVINSECQVQDRRHSFRAATPRTSRGKQSTRSHFLSYRLTAIQSTFPIQYEKSMFTTPTITRYENTFERSERASCKRADWLGPFLGCNPTNLNRPREHVPQVYRRYGISCRHERATLVRPSRHVARPGILRPPRNHTTRLYLDRHVAKLE